MIWNDDDPDLFGRLYGWLLCIFHLLQLIPGCVISFSTQLILNYVSHHRMLSSSTTSSLNNDNLRSSSYLTGSTSTSRSQSEASVTCVIAFL